MPTLLKSPLVLTRSKKVKVYSNTAIDNSIPIMSRHTCPCCSYMLLRHIRRGAIYWRCSHCYQEMPVL